MGLMRSEAPDEIETQVSASCRPRKGEKAALGIRTVLMFEYPPYKICGSRDLGPGSGDLGRDKTKGSR